MREIKYRQRIKDSWHYWGFMKEEGRWCFTGPETTFSTLDDALEKSYQFTGLHDKNGKEIWEGDIVEYFYEWWNTGGMGETKKAVIEWDTLNAMFHIYKAMKVIGNVLENPELLEGK